MNFPLLKLLQTFARRLLKRHKFAALSELKWWTEIWMQKLMLNGVHEVARVKWNASGERRGKKYGATQNIKNHFWWWKYIKKCNCYLGECAESDHYLLRLHRHISLAPFPPLRYYSFGEESRLIFLSSLYPPFSHHLPHTHSRLLVLPLLTAHKKGDCSLSSWWKGYQLIVSQSPLFWAHWGMKIWQLI